MRKVTREELERMILNGEDYSQVDVSKIKDFSWLFYNKEVLFDITNWNTANAVDMRGMFCNAGAFNQPIGKWDVSNVENMSEMFRGAKSFNQNISDWNVSNVEYMSGMFAYSTSFNQSLNDWNVSNVRNMSVMFESAEAFNQPLNNWNMSNVRYMAGIFSGAYSFNQDISDWNVSNVEDMAGMFRDAKSFNQDISGWNVSRVMYMSYMFCGAKSFNQLLEWDLTTKANHRLENMFKSSNIAQPIKGLPLNEYLQADTFKLPNRLKHKAILEAELDLVMFALNFEDRPDVVGKPIDFEQDNKLIKMKENYCIRNSEDLFIKIDDDLAKEIKSTCDKKLYERPKPTPEPKQDKPISKPNRNKM